MWCSSHGQASIGSCTETSPPRLWRNADPVSSAVFLACTADLLGVLGPKWLFSHVHVEWVCMGHPSLPDCCLPGFGGPSACLVGGVSLADNPPVEGGPGPRPWFLTGFHLWTLSRVEWKTLHSFPPKIYLLKNSANDTRSSCRPSLEPGQESPSGS